MEPSSGRAQGNRTNTNDESASSTSTSVSPITPRKLLHSSDENTADDNDDDDDGPPQSFDFARPSLADTHAYKPSIAPKGLGRGGTLGFLDEPIGVGSTRAGTNNPQARRRLWIVQDANLRPRPSAYPPLMDRGPLFTTTSAVVMQTTPSVAAVRISEALRRWPAAVEYDEESSTATAWTSDRCCATIHLWRPSGPSTSALGDVLVECVRVRGSPVTFGHLCQTVLNAAQGMATGADLRRAHQTSVLEMGERWEQRPSAEQAGATDSPPNFGLVASKSAVTLSSIAQDLELVDGLLQKDRWDAHQLGLERLVALVDVFTSGVDVSVAVARSIVMKPGNYRFLWRLIVDKVSGDDDAAASSTTLGGVGVGGDDDFVGFQRSVALRILANALTILDRYDVKRTMQTYSLSASVPGLISALLEDVSTGPSRPPSVTGLAGPHEAVYAIRCLLYLGVPDADKEEALEDLEKARAIGHATNVIMEGEARGCYLALTEADRSC
jgi:hypothetical protein